MQRSAGGPGKIPVSALYATFNINENGNAAREEGWMWMEDFFREPREKLGHHFTVFGTPEECAQTLESYIDAGLTTVVARLASPDLKGQMQRFVKELRPRLSL